MFTIIVSIIFKLNRNILIFVKFKFKKNIKWNLSQSNQIINTNYFYIVYED